MATVQHDSTFALVREQMPSTANFVFLNAGSYGPIPRVTVEAMNAQIEREFHESRSFVVQKDVSEAARQAFARTFNCDTANVALTRHTTDGMNIGILGLNWQQGDEVIITDTEHPGGQYPVYVVARRYGVEVRRVRLGIGDGDVVGKIEAAITPRTRAIVTSHLTWNTGTVLPIKQIADLAHRHDILLFCDAAQSAGSIPADMQELGVDVYATPGQKWMCAPEGTGAAYVSDRAIERVSPTFAGSHSFAAVEHEGGYFVPHRGAKRFEVAGINQPVVLGYATSVNWMRDDIGMDWIYERIARLGRYAHERISSLDGIRVVTPKERMAGLISFQIDCMPPSELVIKLAARKIIIRHIGYPICARIATGFYNSEEDIDTLIDAITEAQDEVNSQSS